MLNQTLTTPRVRVFCSTCLIDNSGFGSFNVRHYRTVCEACCVPASLSRACTSKLGSERAVFWLGLLLGLRTKVSVFYIYHNVNKLL